MTALTPTTRSGPILEVVGVSKSFGGVRALNGVSITASEHEIVGVIGPNGAGKTTLFDLISGFTSVDEGEIILDGRDVTRRRPEVRAQLGLGRSFQDSRLFSGLTVAETIATALERHVAVKDPLAAILHVSAVGRSEAAVRSRVEELVELMGLGAFHDKFISELSTGSRRIVDLACVLAHEPTILLLDEPSSGIAQRETEALGPLLRGIHEQTGAGMLLIEHDMAMLTSVADHIIALDLGCKIAEGSASEVLSHPAVMTSYLGEAIALEEPPPTRRKRAAPPEDAPGSAFGAEPAAANGAKGLARSSLRELQDEARRQGVRGRSTMDRAQLVAALKRQPGMTGGSRGKRNAKAR